MEAQGGQAGQSGCSGQRTHQHTVRGQGQVANSRRGRLGGRRRKAAGGGREPGGRVPGATPCQQGAPCQLEHDEADLVGRDVVRHPPVEQVVPQLAVADAKL